MGKKLSYFFIMTRDMYDDWGLEMAEINEHLRGRGLDADAIVAILLHEASGKRAGLLVIYKEDDRAIPKKDIFLEIVRTGILTAVLMMGRTPRWAGTVCGDAMAVPENALPDHLCGIQDMALSFLDRAIAGFPYPEWWRDLAWEKGWLK